MEKTLTISIAAYNVENYIRQTLDSLIDEEIIEELEIFVVDDGGTDKTLEIAQEYANQYPQSIFPVHKENGGYGSTINTSIKLATGKYFKQLDGDDWFLTVNLKEMIATMKSVSVDCMLTDYIRFYETSGKTLNETPYSGLEEGVYFLEESGIEECNTMYVCAFRTELLQEMPYRLTEHCFYTDNEYIALPLPYLNTIYILHKAIYVYRIGAEGQSMNVTGLEKHYKEHETVFWRLLNIYRTIPEERETNKKIFQNLVKSRLLEHYRYLCLLPQAAPAKQELKKFIQKVQKECPELLYILETKYKRVRIMINSRFFAYPFISRKIKQEWKAKGRI